MKGISVKRKQNKKQKRKNTRRRTKKNKGGWLFSFGTKVIPTAENENTDVKVSPGLSIKPGTLANGTWIKSSHFKQYTDLKEEICGICNKKISITIKDNEYVYISQCGKYYHNKCFLKSCKDSTPIRESCDRENQCVNVIYFNHTK